MLLSKDGVVKKMNVYMHSMDVATRISHAASFTLGENYRKQPQQSVDICLLSTPNLPPKNHIWTQADTETQREDQSRSFQEP